MSTETMAAASSEAFVKLPVQAPRAVPETSPLVERLVSVHGATWVDETSISAWAAEGGDRVVLFAGDAVQFPEGQDVAVVLPELQRCFPRRFKVAVVPREIEQDLAKRYGSQRWPTLLFLRDGQYVTTLCGMHDWDDYVREMSRALAMPISRAPTIGIPVVSATASGTSCH
ncbi:MAG: hydrogenase [Rhodoferax sp.]